MSNWADWLKVIQLKARYLFGLFALGIMVLIIPEKFSKPLFIFEIRQKYGGIIGIASLGSFIFGIIQFIPVVEKWMKSNATKSSRLKTLFSLSRGEFVIIAYCIDNDQQSIQLNIIDADAKMLCQKNILHQSQGAGNKFAWAYKIDDYIWDFLADNGKEISSLYKLKWNDIDKDLVKFAEQMTKINKLKKL